MYHCAPLMSTIGTNLSANITKYARCYDNHSQI